MTYGRQTLDARGRLVRWEFDDVDQMLCQAERPGTWNNSARMGSNTFCGGSFDQALKLARHGWPEGVEMVKKAIADLPPVAGRGVARGYDVAGAYPVAARAAAGMPDAMRTRKRDAGSRPVVRVAVDLCVSKSTGTSAMVAHGASLLSVIDSIEQAGTRVEVMIGATTESDHDDVVRTVVATVKRAQDPYNLDTLAFWLIHPTAFRRILFGVWDSDRLFEPLGYSYGRVRRLNVPDAIVPPSSSEYHRTLRRDPRAELVRWFESKGIQV